MRADVVVTMDMFFDPRGPPGTHPHDDHAADEHHPHEEDIVMEEDIMMMMPEGHEDEEVGGDETAGFGDEMFRMFTGAPLGEGHNADNDHRDPQQQPQQQDQATPAANTQQPPPPGVRNMGNGIHFAAGSGRSVGEAFAQLFARMSGAGPQAQPGQANGQAAPAQPHDEGVAQPPQPPSQENAPADGQPRRPPTGPRPFVMPAGMFGGFPGMMAGAFGPRPPRREGPKPAWSLPPAPGLSLRQRVERREREAGLRCCDISCGLGPSDEDPFTDKVSEAVSAMKQLSIRGNTEDGASACEHRFHSACLVSAERVALRGADSVSENGQVNVSCPVCRTTGCVTQQEWDEGVLALEA